MCVGGVSTTGARRLHVRLIRRSSEVDFFLCRFRLRRLLGLMMALRLVRYWHTVAGAIDNFGARCWQWGLLWLRRRYTSGSGAQRRSGRLTIADIHASQMVAFRILRECICSAGDFFFFLCEFCKLSNVVEDLPRSWSSSLNRDELLNDRWTTAGA